MKADSFCMRRQDSPVSENFSDATWLYINSQRSSCKRRKTDYEYLKCPVWGVTRRDRIRYKEVCDWVDLLQDVANRIQQRRMQYFGHVQRMDHTRYPKLALHGYVHGTRTHGRPKKRWIDMVKDDCRQRDLDIHQATEMTQHRSAWRSLVKLPMRAITQVK